MKFLIERICPSAGLVTHPEEWPYIWTLRKGDDAICMAASRFSSEKNCRSDIARARKSMPGVKFAKVEVIDD